ncbi:GATA zinc finger domain-containing protein 6-like [Panonychus citri]|uniref:GATA zinc finger domain-containing protein 6-like n=1 Tax=Panonychus citri TaxID=50023 RepID=UPI002307D4DD|nr:GATA zinc finger domain-containing protein 6-like [Panonychus citri]
MSGSSSGHNRQPSVRRNRKVIVSSVSSSGSSSLPISRGLGRSSGSHGSNSKGRVIITPSSSPPPNPTATTITTTTSTVKTINSTGLTSRSTITLPVRPTTEPTTPTTIPTIIIEDSDSSTRLTNDPIITILDNYSFPEAGKDVKIIDHRFLYKNDVNLSSTMMSNTMVLISHHQMNQLHVFTSIDLIFCSILL